MHRYATYALVGFASMGLLVLSGASSTDKVSEPSRAQTVRRVLPMSVRIQVLSGDEVKRSATGVVVRAETTTAVPAGHSYILTNAHVADPAGLKAVSYKVLLEKHGRVERTFPAKLIGLGKVPDEDLALLEIDSKLPAAEISSEEAVDVGDDVVVIGAPYGKSLSASGGMVSQLEAEGGTGSEPLRYKAMKTDAAIGYGSSGGGVFSVSTGRLVGLVEGYRTARVTISERQAFDVPMPGETFVAPVTKIRKFMAQHLGNAEVAAVQNTEEAKPKSAAIAH